MTTLDPTLASSSMNGEAATRAIADLDWKKILNFGGILGLGQVFIALSGMPVGLDRRTIVDSVLGLGYLALFLLPIIVGYAVGNEKVLEGMAVTRKGTADLVAGAVVGLIGGAALAVLTVLIDNFDLGEPLVNWGTPMLDVLTFGQATAVGVILWLVISSLLGLFGASFHLMQPLVRTLLTRVAVVVIGFAIFEAIITDLLKGFGLRNLAKLIYANSGGLNIAAAVILIVLTVGISVVGKGRVKQASEKFQALEGEDRTRANTVRLVLIAAALVILPMFVGKITNELLANVGLFLLLALGLNIVVGLAGILDLGYVAFFAVGGYTTAVLTSPNSPGFSPELPWVVAIFIVVPIAALVGLLIGAPVIRMRGDYLAIVTLGFGEIIRLLFLSDWLKGWFGGSQGITNIPGIDLGFATIKGTDPRAVFYLVLVFCILAIYISWRLEKSRLGRAWMAIREDESVAEAMGINTVNMKLLAFVVGAVLASFSGAIFAAKVSAIFPTSFLILVSIIILVVVIVGGIGNIAGVIAGAVVLIGVLGGPKQPGLLQEFAEYKLLIYGALLIWMMLKRPEGLIPNVRRTRELHQDEFLQDAWLKGEIDSGDDDDDAPAPGGAGAMA